MGLITFFLLVLFAITSFYLGYFRSNRVRVIEKQRPISLDKYYGYYLAIWSVVPAVIILFAILIFDGFIVKNYVLSEFYSQGIDQSEISLLFTQIENTRNGIKLFNSGDQIIVNAVNKLNYIEGIFDITSIITVFGVSSLFLLYGYRRINLNFDARLIVEKFILIGFFLCSLIAILVTIGIIFSLLYETVRFFSQVPILDFLFGTNWSPQRAFVRDAADAADIENAFGAVPLFSGTFLIAFIAMCVSIPVGLLTAIYMSEYAKNSVRNTAKPIIEILAGIPTVVYGFFAVITIAPLIRSLGGSIGLDVSSESALAAGLVMGIMIIPFVSSLSDDVISSVPQSLREGSYAMGATKSETIKKVIIPAALPGIIGSFLLAVSRAIGETMIVVMAAGLVANLTANPLEASTTITTQIVVILIGDQEFDSPKTMSAFALGLTLFVMTLVLNFIALRVVKKYTEKYE
tara:strand:+ start:2333 stop:3715 length:1383 start_codon:yes stop_codon:yes gene_type:complete